MSASDRQPRFHAFISYSHQQPDVPIWLHRLLERYWVPGYRQRTVFLDREHLVANELGPMIIKALQQSRFLIVLCSNEARGSKWVDREVDHFVAKHGNERVLGVRVGLADDAAMLASLEHHQALAGKLAALALLHGDPALAHSLRAPLRAMDETLARVPHCAAIGLAWAALADSAFDRHGSDQLLAQAKACGSAEQPMSKTWEEWHTIAKALTEQNRWLEAWALPAEVRDTGARMRLTADLMDRYAHWHCRTQAIVFTPWPTHVTDCAPVRLKRAPRTSSPSSLHP